MRYLLDTHALLWWVSEPALLSKEALAVLEDGNTTVYVSAVSAWEIVVKRALGKLDVTDKIFDVIEEQFVELPVFIAHTKTLAKLPSHHKDPFDRLLIAQAKTEGMTLISRDTEFVRYKVPLLVA